jgi:hypothetical protein
VIQKIMLASLDHICSLNTRGVKKNQGTGTGKLGIRETGNWGSGSGSGFGLKKPKTGLPGIGLNIYIYFFCVVNLIFGRSSLGLKLALVSILYT